MMRRLTVALLGWGLMAAAHAAYDIDQLMSDLATQKGGRFQPQARGADGDRVSPRCQPRLEPCRLMPPL